MLSHRRFGHGRSSALWAVLLAFSCCVASDSILPVTPASETTRDDPEDSNAPEPDEKDPDFDDSDPEPEGMLAWQVGKVTAGGFHTCAIRDDAEAYCWGSNRSGQLGVGADISDATRPMQVRHASDIVAIAAGFESTCGIFVDGSVKCWGLNSAGQLGDGTQQNRAEPVEVKGLEGEVVSLALGDAHSCALLSSGDVQCWGDNSQGQLGNDELATQLRPTQVPGLSSVTQLAAGSGHTCALTRSGEVRCWGKTTEGQSPLHQVKLAAKATAVAAGSSHSCALLAGGSVQCWGWNKFGQVGNGSTVDVAAPVPVAFRSGVEVISLELGSAHSCAQTKRGETYCWGNNELGQFGDESTVSTNAPVRMPEAFEDLRAMAAGTAHACGEFTTGVLKCWGANDDGVLGNGTKGSETQLYPRAVYDFSLLD
jgi:alpha-tubulin suppressor-like RCC1 family protein